MRPVVVGCDEAHAVIGQLDGIAVGKHLEAARIGQDRPVPVHEGVQAAELIDQVLAGTHGQVVGVGEHDLRAELTHGLGGDALNVGLGTHRHEDGRLDIAMRRVQDARARMRLGILGDDIVGEQALVHGASLLQRCFDQPFYYGDICGMNPYRPLLHNSEL